MNYRAMIETIAPMYDARQIEAFMRSEHNTLDGLSPMQFHAEVRIACACIDEAGPQLSERIAKSFGF